MTAPRIITAFLFATLAVQIVTLDVDFKMTNISHGSFVERVRKEVLVVRNAIERVTYTAKRTEQYDSLVFVGDVMLARNVEVLMQREGADYPYRGTALSALVPRAAVIGNFESSMSSPHIPTEAYQMRFSTQETFVPPLAEAGFTHLSLANNHSFDYGVVGYENALSLLSKSGLEIFGHGNELGQHSISYIETREGGSVALVGVNASARIPTKKDINTLLTLAAKKSDLQVVYIHWGTEYELVHSTAQELLAKELVAAGADLIVGHHPHVVQDVDVIDGVVVFYSLGNYIFDQYFSPDVMEGLVLVLELNNDPVIGLVPVRSSETLSQPKVMSPEEQRSFLLALAERSDEQIRPMLERGFVPLTDLVATSTKMAIMMQ